MKSSSIHHSALFAKNLLAAHNKIAPSLQIKLQGSGAETLEAMFLGTRGSNAETMSKMLAMALKGHVEFRRNYFPEDPDYLDVEIQNSEGFKNTVKFMEDEYQKLIVQLQESGTFFSMRSIGHMLWDTTTPGILGYFAALLYNQNNVAAEASPVTTLLEMQVGNELCKMLGYEVTPIPTSQNEKIPDPIGVTAWGHITCDGSVANLEALWMARNLKFYPISLKAAILNEPSLQIAKDFQVKLLNGESKRLIELDNWTLLNLPIDETLDIPNKIKNQYNLDLGVIGNTIANYTIQNLGYLEIFSKYLPEVPHVPVSYCSAARHYSWPKGAAILGIGSANMISIRVDEKVHMDLGHLKEELDKCLQTKTPVMNVVAIIGTTEESAVDPLKEILALRETYRTQGLEFAIHADAAWGGYFKTMLNSSDESDPRFFTKIEESEIAILPMSEYVKTQYEVIQQADSITIDPHKSGYVPYPAGGLCYRNSAMRNLVSFTAPVVYHGGVDPTVGVYGVEGSKPGAAAAAVYFSHKVIRPNITGYGKLSGACFFNSKRLYAALVCMNIEALPFFIIPLVPIPAVQQGKSEDEVQAQYEFIRDRIVNKTNQEIMADSEAFELFKELGGDQTIVTYLYNFYEEGKPNPDMIKTNKFNDAIYKMFSFKPYEENTEETEIVVTSSAFTRSGYGDCLVDDLRKRMGVTTGKDEAINFIISTVMNPWLTNTVQGSFIPTLINIITKNISICLENLQATNFKDKP